MVSPAETAPDTSAGAGAPLLQQPLPTTTKSPPEEPEIATRRCFVCLVDEPETDLPSDWSTPCRCSLEGHQDCLLDWVADLESQEKAVACPQCKSKIRVDDRYDVVIKVSDTLNRILSDWSPTILLGFLGSGTVVASAFYGLEAIQIFAGPEVAKDFLIRQVPHNPLPPAVQSVVSNILPNLPESWAFQTIPDIKVGNLCLLPLIGPSLILNRLNLGGPLLVPPSLMATGYMYLGYPDKIDQVWPPSFEQAMLLYPAVKSTYFFLYKRLITPLETKWDTMAKRWTLQDHQQQEEADGDGEEQGRAPVPNPPPPDEEPPRGNFQMELELGVGFRGDDGPEPDNNPDGADPADPDNPAPPPRQQRMLEVGDRSPFNFLAGALLFPVVCYGMGEVMRHLLPKRLVARPGHGPATGLLQEQWGRSLIGGCLFVVLKDAFFLYVKYRRALNRPHRKIKNAQRRDVKN